MNTKNAFDFDQALLSIGFDQSTSEVVALNRSYGGLHIRVKHFAKSLNCEMIVGVFLPACVFTRSNKKVPTLYWLSGLTCTDQNFLTKAHALKTASELGIALICPDTSPRGEGVANDDAYDLGQGAGFYLNASQQPWQEHFQMYSYIKDELIEWSEHQFPINDKRSVSGHSMGGHGALTIAFKNPGLFQSVSAFSPICNPVAVPWGQKAFKAYLGEDQVQWQSYDATELLPSLSERLPILIDQGTHDQFLEEQLSTQYFADQCQQYNHPLTLNMRDGYDHSYFFISTFIDEHLFHHAQALGVKAS